MKFKDINSKQLSEGDIMIYLLAESGLNHSEIGRRLGMPDTTVGVRYRKAQSLIKKGNYDTIK